jgi:hypothetical protein
LALQKTRPRFSIEKRGQAKRSKIISSFSSLLFSFLASKYYSADSRERKVIGKN